MRRDPLGVLRGHPSEISSPKAVLETSATARGSGKSPSPLPAAGGDVRVEAGSRGGSVAEAADGSRRSSSDQREAVAAVALSPGRGLSGAGRGGSVVGGTGGSSWAASGGAPATPPGAAASGAPAPSPPPSRPVPSGGVAGGDVLHVLTSRTSAGAARRGSAGTSVSPTAAGSARGAPTSPFAWHSHGHHITQGPFQQQQSAVATVAEAAAAGAGAPLFADGGGDAHVQGASPRRDGMGSMPRGNAGGQHGAPPPPLAQQRSTGSGAPAVSPRTPPPPHSIAEVGRVASLES